MNKLLYYLNKIFLIKWYYPFIYFFFIFLIQLLDLNLNKYVNDFMSFSPLIWLSIFSIVNIFRKNWTQGCLTAIFALIIIGIALFFLFVSIVAG